MFFGSYGGVIPDEALLADTEETPRAEPELVMEESPAVGPFFREFPEAVLRACYLCAQQAQLGRFRDGNDETPIALCVSCVSRLQAGQKRRSDKALLPF